ncbi:MAG: hypothetical protein KJ072_21100 [Verrucomicrobia bacterium]|nr:hypothetical protein [Verrucomicrobiota bacterium]
MTAQIDCFRPAGTNHCLAAHADLLRGTPLEPILEPRRFQAPAGYHSTKCVAAGLFLLLGQGRIKDQLGLPQVPTEINAHGIAYQVIRHRAAVFFVREDFARAVAATDLPHDFTLDDLHWPLPGMVVGFPPRFMQEYVGRDTCYVYAANCDAGDYQVPALAGCPTVTVPRSKVGWQWYSWREGNLESFVTSYFRGDRVDEAITNYGYTDYTGIKDTEGIEADRIATDRVSTLMLKLLVVLNTRPSLVEYGQCERPQRLRHGRVKQRELWSPNLIGWHYRPVDMSPASGTHASPRIHWRRGHVRNQPHGPGRIRRKLIWIEPQLIGVDQDEPNNVGEAAKGRI